MNADADLQVWLETIANTHPRMIVPYVQSTGSGSLHYEVRLIRHGSQGNATITQDRTVNVLADTPTPLASMSINSEADDDCIIVFKVIEASGTTTRAGTLYQFSCPR